MFGVWCTVYTQVTDKPLATYCHHDKNHKFVFKIYFQLYLPDLLYEIGQIEDIGQIETPDKDLVGRVLIISSSFTKSWFDPKIN